MPGRAIAAPRAWTSRCRTSVTTARPSSSGSLACHARPGRKRRRLADLRGPAKRVEDPLGRDDPRRGTRRFKSIRPDQLIGPVDDAEPASQVTLPRSPDHVCDRSPDSVKFGAEIRGFRAHDERGIAKIGHLTLDQEIEGSNPSSPATPRHVGSSDFETTRYCGSELDRWSRRGGSTMRNSSDSTPGLFA